MLRKIYNKIFGVQKKVILRDSNQSYIDSGFVKIGQGTLQPNLSVRIRLEHEGKTFLTIGKNSVISGNYVFENENGSIKIGDRTFIGGGNFISINNIEIGDDVLISWGCTFMDNNAHSLQCEERKNDVLDWKRGIEEKNVGAYKNWAHVESAPIVIKDKAWIGFDVVILKGVIVGEGAVVAARSVVTKDVPPFTVVAGNPAQIIKTLEP